MDKSTRFSVGGILWILGELVFHLFMVRSLDVSFFSKFGINNESGLKIEAIVTIISIILIIYKIKKK